MAARACFCISSHFCQELRVYLQVSILRDDESHLPQVEGFTSDIDVGDREKVEPKLGFEVINNRNPAPSSGTVRTSALPFDYRITREGPALHGQAKISKYPGGNLQIINVSANLLKEAALEDHLRIKGMHSIHHRARVGEERGVI